MQPEIISKGVFCITGKTGDGARTGEVWGEFDSMYNANPFAKIDENGYEVRFWDMSGETQGVHVGFLTEPGHKIGGFDAMVIPPSEYAVFEVFVAKGYDSGNAEMDKWLDDNKQRLHIRDIDGKQFVIEYYDEKFLDGDKPESIVTFWVPFVRI